MVEVLNTSEEPLGFLFFLTDLHFQAILPLQFYTFVDLIKSSEVNMNTNSCLSPSISWEQFIWKPTYNDPKCAYDTPFPKGLIRTLLKRFTPILGSKGFLFLSNLLDYQNQHTAQLNITNDTISRDIGLCKTYICELMTHFKRTLGEFFESHIYKPDKYHNRRQLNIRWMGVFLILREKMREHTGDPNWTIFEDKEKERLFFGLNTDVSPKVHTCDTNHSSSSSSSPISSSNINKMMKNETETTTIERGLVSKSPTETFHENISLNQGEETVTRFKRKPSLVILPPDDEIDKTFDIADMTVEKDDAPPPPPLLPGEGEEEESVLLSEVLDIPKIKENTAFNRVHSPMVAEKDTEPERVSRGFSPTNKYRSKIEEIENEAARRLDRWLENNSQDSLPYFAQTPCADYLRFGFKDEAIAVLKALTLLTEEEMEIDMNPDYWIQLGYNEERDEYLKTHPKEITRQDKDRWTAEEAPETEGDRLKRRFRKARKHPNFDHIVNVQVDPRYSLPGETQWDTLKRRMRMNPKYNPFEDPGQRWDDKCYWEYALMSEEERDREFRKYVNYYFKRPTNFFTENTLKHLKKARAMADECGAKYVEWIGAQYRLYTTTLRYTHLLSKFAPKIYREFKKAGWNLPVTEGSAIVNRYSAIGKGKQDPKAAEKRDKKFFESWDKAQALVSDYCLKFFNKGAK